MAKLTFKERLIEILVKSKHLSQEQLDKAIQIQRQRGGQLKHILIEQSLISEEELLSIISSELYIPTLHLTKYKIDSSILDTVPERVARQYLLMPISRIGNTLTVAMSDPLNIFALDDLKTLTGYNIDPVLSPESEILKAVDAYYHPEIKDIKTIMEKESSSNDIQVLKEDTLELTSAIKESQNPPIVKVVDLMVAEALKRRASDIHIEPAEGDLRIRYRIDGDLQDVFTLPKSNQNAVLARLKIISGLDITESRIPQDGRFKVRIPFPDGRGVAKEVDFRVSCLPTNFGQKFVLRALDKSNLSIGLERLGFSERPHNLFKEAIAKPYGMMLVTGPTGSGKSTTLYSIINQLNTPERSIITIEDPVEYMIEGLTQIHVKPEIGLDFASGLRSLLRQNPDVIMIGEIRDSETADIAVKASLTGQMVLSTLHTNDAAGAITRLIDMGVEPFLVASSIIMTCAQRLCRKICPNCKEPADVPKKILEKMGIKDITATYRGRGCSHCNQTGYFGRIAILEVMMIDDKIREMIIKSEPIDQIKDYALSSCGMNTLRDDAIIKVKSGITTLEEALRITTED